MKNLKQEQQGNQSVFTGDQVYFNHPEHGALSGSVVAVGKHGVQVDSEHGRHPVVWGDLLGHKVRSERKFTLVDKGEDGGIALDENGKRVFIAGGIPDDEPEKDEEDEPLAKSHIPVETPVSSLRDQAVIDAALISAGFVPSLEYIQRTYGDHWTVRDVAPPAVVSFDSEPLVRAIADVKASCDASITAVRSDMASNLTSLSVAIQALTPKVM